MDLVYVCKPGQHNEELRYSIRSAVANLPHDNIWVIGGKPDWYTGNFIKTNRKIDKYDTVRENLRTACNDPRISDDFILMNDDFFIIKPVLGTEVWHHGQFPSDDDLIIMAKENGYFTLMQDTKDLLIYLGIEKPINYELHIPMVMNKNKLKNILDISRLWRSVYGNIFTVGGIAIEDVKIRIDSLDTLEKNNYNVSSLAYISTEDNTCKVVIKNILSKMFPEASKYEY